jgi:hypothetical protein
VETCGRTPLGVRIDGDTTHVFELVQTSSAFGRVPVDSADCTSLVVEMGLFQPGAQVGDRFPSAVVLQTGTGDLHLTRFVGSFSASSSPNPSRSDLGPDQPFIALDPGGEFLDAQGRACSVEPATDGSLRCLPTRSLVTEAAYFRDDTCTERLWVAAQPDVELSELKLVRRRADYTGAIEALFSLLAHTGTVYQVDRTQCVSAGAATTPLLARDQELPLDTLVRVESVEM